MKESINKVRDTVYKLRDDLKAFVQKSDNRKHIVVEEDLFKTERLYKHCKTLENNYLSKEYKFNNELEKPIDTRNNQIINENIDNYARIQVAKNEVDLSFIAQPSLEKEKLLNQWNIDIKEENQLNEISKYDTKDKNFNKLTDIYEAVTYIAKESYKDNNENTNSRISREHTADRIADKIIQKIVNANNKWDLGEDDSIKKPLIHGIVDQLPLSKGGKSLLNHKIDQAIYMKERNQQEKENFVRVPNSEVEFSM